jgi:hypothetical protein
LRDGQAPAERWVRGAGDDKKLLEDNPQESKKEQNLFLHQYFRAGYWHQLLYLDSSLCSA